MRAYKEIHCTPYCACAPCVQTDKQNYNIEISESTHSLCRVGTYCFTHYLKIQTVTSLDSCGYTLHKHLQAQNIIFQVKTHISGPVKWWRSISADRQKPEILRFLRHQLILIIIIFKIFSLNSDEISALRKQILIKHISIGSTCFWHSYHVYWFIFCKFFDPAPDPTHRQYFTWPYIIAGSLPCTRSASMGVHICNSYTMVLRDYR